MASYGNYSYLSIFSGLVGEILNTLRICTQLPGKAVPYSSGRNSSFKVVPVLERKNFIIYIAFSIVPY